jgi:hypothetical protein
LEILNLLQPIAKGAILFLVYDGRFIKDVRELYKIEKRSLSF